MPDLILMDGGQIQVEACLDVLRNELNVNIPVAGMVKDDHHRTNHLILVILRRRRIKVNSFRSKI